MTNRRLNGNGGSTALLILLAIFLAAPLVGRAEQVADDASTENPMPESTRGERFTELQEIFTQEGGYVSAYGADSSRGENPTNIGVDLNRSFPQPDAIFKTRIPIEWFAWKEDLYQRTGIKLAFSYQSLYQTTSDSNLPTDTFWGGWLLVESKWEAINRNEDYEGSLVAVLDWKDSIGGGNDDPFLSVLSSGSVWPNDTAYLSWDPWMAALYWEQRLRKEDNFVFRIGTQAAVQFIDFSRYKDPRVSFTGSPFTGGFETIPTPAPGLGASFRWNTSSPSEFYVVGSINDINADPQDAGFANWSTAWEEGEFFYALEFGKNWRRSPRDFDHLHVLITYADDRSTPLIPAPPIPQEGGFGFKISGEKQWDRLVGFASYGFNDAEGGPFASTLVRHAVTAGFAVNRPLGINGEVGVGAAWAEPIDGINLFFLPQNPDVKNQYGLEMYWRMLVTSDLWVTPGMQVVFNPAYNPNTDAVVLPSLKFRFFL